LLTERRDESVASKFEIIDAIRAGANRVEATFSQLSDDQLDTRIHDGDRGWTARKILAHLASRGETYELLIKLTEESSGAPPGGFDIDSWNARLVNGREGRSRDELLNEFRSVHEGLIERVSTMREDQLSRQVVLPSRETTLGDVLLGSGGMHSIQHSEEVEKALNLPN
jgi:hypothetical protein